jgi:hypothetical protein
MKKITEPETVAIEFFAPYFERDIRIEIHPSEARSAWLLERIHIMETGGEISVFLEPGIPSFEGALVLAARSVSIFALGEITFRFYSEAFAGEYTIKISGHTGGWILEQSREDGKTGNRESGPFITLDEALRTVIELAVEWASPLKTGARDE